MLDCSIEESKLPTIELFFRLALTLFGSILHLQHALMTVESRCRLRMESVLLVYANAQPDSTALIAHVLTP